MELSTKRLRGGSSELPKKKKAYSNSIYFGQLVLNGLAVRNISNLNFFKTSYIVFYQEYNKNRHDYKVVWGVAIFLLKECNLKCGNVYLFKYRAFGSPYFKFNLNQT